MALIDVLPLHPSCMWRSRRASYETMFNGNEIKSRIQLFEIVLPDVFTPTEESDMTRI